MIEKILFGLGMFIVTLAIQFFLFKKNKQVSFWSGTEPVYVMCFLGLLTNDPDYLAGILGYVVADSVGKFAGWHNANKEE